MVFAVEVNEGNSIILLAGDYQFAIALLLYTIFLNSKVTGGKEEILIEFLTQKQSMRD